jgi:transcriptional regulator of acetoin/glycerol metabolism
MPNDPDLARLLELWGRLPEGGRRLLRQTAETLCGALPGKKRGRARSGIIGAVTMGGCNRLSAAEMSPGGERWSAKDHLFAAAVAAGHTIVAAAATAKVSRSTAWRRNRDAAPRPDRPAWGNLARASAHVRSPAITVSPGRGRTPPTAGAPQRRCL